jgi:hypothetical protein
MTVGELRKKLEGIDPKTSAVIYRETDAGTEFFEISDVNPSAGTPIRNEDTGKAGFRFESAGPATWLFISIEDA